MPVSAQTSGGSAITRVVLIVLDSVGIGALPDAAAYGDEGSDTLGHVAERWPLQIPTLRSLGLAAIARVSGPTPVDPPLAAYGRMRAASPGKDSITGHWELTGVVLDRAFPVFPAGFPAEALALFERRIGRRTLGNRAASGTAIIEDLGTEHQRTGAPIVYTSADSVCQIAAHESIVPLEQLYAWCDIAYEIMCEGVGVARVIARPFVGEAGRYTRTAARRDFARPPAGETLLDLLTAARLPVVALGKIEDLFAGRGITRAVHAPCDDEVMDALEAAMDATPRGLLFANLVDFDSTYGHRNDPEGYASNLECFDARLSELMSRLQSSDVLVITADHGNDPTTPSTDHSREYVPLLVYGVFTRGGVNLGTRATFADVGQTVAEMLGVGPLRHGESFLVQIACAGGDRPAAAHGGTL